jgi:hypothetical protein
MTYSKSQQYPSRIGGFFEITHQLASQTENMLNDIVLAYIGFDYQDVLNFEEYYLRSKIKIEKTRLLEETIERKDEIIMIWCVSKMEMNYIQLRNVIEFGIRYESTNVLLACIRDGIHMIDIIKECHEWGRMNLILKLIRTTSLSKDIIDTIEMQSEVKKYWNDVSDRLSSFIDMATCILWVLMMIASILFPIVDHFITNIYFTYALYVFGSLTVFKILLLIYWQIALSYVSEQEKRIKTAYDKNIECLYDPLCQYKNIKYH